MKIVLQRVKRGSVTVDGGAPRKIGAGLVVLFGAEQGDEERFVKPMADKLTGLRIFSDENDKMNLSCADIGGDILAVPNFTLAADCRKGRRPSFTGAGDPAFASKCFDQFVECLKSSGAANVQQGEFGADMEVEIINDGPVTLILDSRDIVKN